MYIVTGASSGIGKATAVALADRGHHVLAVARTAAALSALAADHGGLIQPVVADLSTTAGLQSVAGHDPRDTVEGIVHGAASVIVAEPYLGINPDSLAADMLIHVGAPMRLHQLLSDRLAGTRIVFIDSFSATEMRVGWAGYSIVKAAAQMAARAAAAELPDSTVIRVFPGGVRTPVIDSILAAEHDSPARRLYRELDASGSLAEPRTIGEYIATLLRDTSDADLSATETWSVPASSA